MTIKAGALKVVLAAALGLPLAACGSRMNDTGGIIPWSPENERESFQIAERYCSFWNKFPLATSIHRVPGDYIAYKCVWDPPRAVAQHRRSQRVDVKIEK